MDYRRSEGFIRQSSASRLRDQHRLEPVPDSYESLNRREAASHWPRRSVSPHGLPQDAGVSQRTTSIERRDYGWPLDRGRSSRVRSRSPQPLVSGDPRKRPHFDDGIAISPTPSTELRQRREFAETSNLNVNNDDDVDDDDADLPARRVYGYEPGDPRYSKDEFNDIILSAGDKHRSLGQKSVAVEECVARGSYRSPQNLGPTSVYGDASGNPPSFSRTMDTQHFEHGRLQYQDPVALSKLPVTQSYKDGEKPMFHLGDASYHRVSGSNSKGPASSSPETSRSEFLAYQDGLRLPHINEFKSSTKLTEAKGLSAYKERSILDSARDAEGGQKNPFFYLRACSPNRGEHENYFFPKSREMVDDRGYPADDLHKMMSPRGQLDYTHTQIIYDHRDMSRPSMARPLKDRNASIDDPREYLRKGITCYNPAFEKPSDLDYLDMKRTSHISKQDGEYSGSGFAVELGRTVSQDHEILHLGASKDHQMSGLEADYGFGSNAGPHFQEERVLRTPVSKYETEMYRHNAREQNVRDEHVYIARVHNMTDEAEYETEMHRHNARVQNVRDEHEIYNSRQQIARDEAEYGTEIHRHNARVQNVRDEHGVYNSRLQNVRDEAEYGTEMHRHNARVLNVRDEHEIYNARLQNVGDNNGIYNARVQNVKEEHGIYNTRMHNVRSEHGIYNHRVHNVRDEHGMYKSQDRVVKGRYAKEEVGTYNSRTTTSGKLYSARQFQDVHKTNEEWINKEMSGLHTSRTTGFEHTGYRRAERNHDGLDHHEDFVSDGWHSSQELPHARKHSIGFYKHYGRHIKGRRRPGYSSHYNNSHHYDRKNHLYGQHKFGKRNDGYYEDLHADEDKNDGNPSEYWVIPEESEPNEDSEEFKQLVHEAFLKYAKKLNVNSAVQRRYREEGKAGSLFCIVCGRSVSKEFMDTQRLVTHAYMSHKAGLRSEHLGLHKAICVMLGWSTVVPDETITWVPQILPKSEAFAQKEDLIIWPPVIVIHNVSLSYNNPEKWKVVTVEALEAFIRGKGLIRGRIKVCLGKPADQSVMVVKFLGTFTGLGDAEKLHKYLAEHKHGRVDFELATSNNGGTSINIETGIQGGKVEEHILYGYLGISEDLDKVDFNTRNTCLIKSKMDIQDLADAPVKPEET
ncbi:XS domain containing protein [Trema orientale]|uniref:XS domain containing protein n=1 Tax=Trema orientale TaxID=63057 RepID=A0A2P5AWK0_TREOI|nr:XS domain containing protein [Trema orientale]